MMGNGRTICQGSLQVLLSVDAPVQLHWGSDCHAILYRVIGIQSLNSAALSGNALLQSSFPAVHRIKSQLIGCGVCNCCMLACLTTIWLRPSAIMGLSAVDDWQSPHLSLLLQHRNQSLKSNFMFINTTTYYKIRMSLLF